MLAFNLTVTFFEELFNFLVLGSSSTAAFFITDSYQPAGHQIQLEFEPHPLHHTHAHPTHPQQTDANQVVSMKGRRPKGNQVQPTAPRKPRQTKAQKMLLQQQQGKLAFKEELHNSSAQQQQPPVEQLTSCSNNSANQIENHSPGTQIVTESLNMEQHPENVEEPEE